MAVQYGHRVDNVIVSEDAQAHFGDRITNHYHVGVPAQSITYQALLKSLTFDHMDQRVRNVATAVPMTSEWLPSHELFAVWVDDARTHEHHGILWLKGKPGSGKSTIMKETLSWAKDTWVSRIVISYFFNARSPHILEKSSLGLYRSLVWQLQIVLPGSRRLFEEIFASKIREKEVEPWTEIELQNFLAQVLKQIPAPPIIIFVDALDEGSDDDVRQMVRFLERLTMHAMRASCRLRICLSSRHYPHISIVKGLSIVLEDQPEHGRDIETYIQSELAGGGTAEMDEVGRHIRDRSSGVFLWIVLVVLMLNKIYDQGKQPAIMFRKLQEIPQGLHDLFNQILSKDADDIDECVMLLRWVLFAKQPLTPIELYHAVCYACRQTDSQEIADVTLEQAMRYIGSCSRGLVELTKTEKPTVQFIHETVRGFLTDQAMPQGEEPQIYAPKVIGQDFRADSCHEKLAEICLSYLLQICRLTSPVKDIETAYPLALYAAVNVWRHFQASPDPCGARVIQYAIEFLISSREDIASCVRSREFCLQINRHGSTAPLYHAVTLGRNELVTGILALDPDVNAGGEHYGNALQVASCYGHGKMVKTLLNSGADVHAREGYYDTALQAASRFGRVEIVQMLLQRGADVNTQGGRYGSALLAAIHSGPEVRESVMLYRSLLGLSPYRRKVLRETHPSALPVRHMEVVRMLVEHGAIVNLRRGHFGNALQMASFFGYEEVVQILLDNGVNVNARGGRLGNALMTASYFGHVVAVSR